MASEFGVGSDGFASQTMGWREELPVKSKRFKFYKVRIHGVLQLVKEPKPEFEADLLALESLRKEFTICFGLSHPGIPRYYSFDGRRVFEEFVEGDNLRELIDSKDPRLADNRFLAGLCRSLLQTLDYLHRHGVVHLDVKPENIIVSHIGGVVKLLDYGAAVCSDDASTPGFTPGYMAPEQHDGKVDFYTDIYQTGLLMRELVTAGNRERKWKRFVTRATASNPVERFKSCRRAIESIPSEKRGNKSKGFLLGALGISVLILGMTLVLFQRADDANQSGLEKNHIGPETMSSSPEVVKQEVTSSEKTVDIETSEKPDNPKVSAPAVPAAPVDNGETRLKREIDNFVITICSRNIGPVMSMKRKDEEGKQIPETYDAYREASVKSYNECVAYVKRLSEENPRYAYFVTSYAMRKLEDELNVYFTRFCN